MKALTSSSHQHGQRSETALPVEVGLRGPLNVRGAQEPPARAVEREGDASLRVGLLGGAGLGSGSDEADGEIGQDLAVLHETEGQGAAQRRAGRVWLGAVSKGHPNRLF